jgi:IPT/TIG domain
MRNTLSVFIIVVLLFLSIGCKVSEENNGNGEEPPNTDPQIQSLSPDAIIANASAFTLIVTGTHFNSGSTIVFDGAEKLTVFINETELSCQLLPEDLPENSSGAANNNILSSVDVLVRNKENNETVIKDSNIMEFSLLQNPRFTEPVNISNTEYDGTFPMVAVNPLSHSIHVIWLDNSGWSKGIYYTHSFDAGATWSDATHISAGFNSACCPDIATNDAGFVSVVWYGNRISTNKSGIFSSRSYDDGVTWREPICFSSDHQGYVPDIDGSGTDFTIVWGQPHNSHNMEVYGAASIDNGINWNHMRISSILGTSDSPVIDIGYEGYMFTAWKDNSDWNNNTPAIWEIFTSVSSDGGKTWAPGTNISNDNFNSVKPVIETDKNGRVYVAWFDLGGSERNVWLSQSHDLGANWEVPLIMSKDSPGLSVEPALAADEQANVNLVWGNYNPNISEKLRIMFKRLIGSTNTWTDAVNVSGDGDYISYPDITVDDNGIIYIVWEEVVDNRRQVMFVKSY